MVTGRCAGAGIGLALLAAACTATSTTGPQPATLAADSDCRRVAAVASKAKAIPVGPDGRPLLEVVTVPSQQRKAEAPCVLAIGADATAMTTKVVVASHRTIESSYVDPDGRRINPDYQAVQDALAERERQADIDAAGSEDALTQAVGTIWDGAAYFFRPSDSQLRQQLRSTPHYLDEGEPVPYTLSLEGVDGSKSAKVDLALLDTRTGQAILRAMPFTETRHFEIADNLAPTDLGRHDGEPGFLDRAEIDRWLEAPPLPPLDAALRPFATALAEETRLQGGLPAVIARFEGTASPERADSTVVVAPATMPQGLVAVDGMASEGQGFYVTEDKIVTASSLIGDTSLVKVTDQRGASTYGVVDRRDDSSGLAMIYVQMPGRPLALSETPRGAPAYLQRAEAVNGRPLLSGEGIVTGMVTNAKTRQTVDAPALRAFLHRAGGLDGPAASIVASPTP
ncbi:hypothetical protein SAMN07250955_101315 [Arboricoccus pini]|uniref:Lipoprotein n=1 Tax=Arboricoccus pini TaxID=1963835 RepID=A0A212Q0R5_9PROT|nr:hypothetical protein [Arboricoccus pini]SNB52951.1 hypothetical protein SAMN07250955_101315 [Arboricoccus pini]